MLDNGVIPLGSNPAGVEAGGPGLLARVQRPSYNNAQGQLMYMVGAGSSDPSVVYGLFANTDGSGMHWERLASVGANLVVSALSSANGTTIFAGTAQGTIHSIQPDPVAKATVLQWPITAPSQAVGSIRSVAELFSSLGFAATNGGSVLVFNGQTWDLVGGGLPTSLPFTAVAAADTGWVFAATRQQVYVTHDLGSTWLVASTGLPAVAQAESLRYVQQPDGSRFLYLATYGWSMFRARLPNG